MGRVQQKFGNIMDKLAKEIKEYFINRGKISQLSHPLSQIKDDKANDVLILYMCYFIGVSKYQDFEDNTLKYHKWILEHITPMLLKHNIKYIAISTLNKDDGKLYAIKYFRDIGGVYTPVGKIYNSSW